MSRNASAAADRADTTAGERFARAFLAKDWDGVAGLLDPHVDFRGLTPGRAWEASTAQDLIQQVLSKSGSSQATTSTR